MCAAQKTRIARQNWNVCLPILVELKTSVCLLFVRDQHLSEAFNSYVSLLCDFPVFPDSEIKLLISIGLSRLSVVWISCFILAAVKRILAFHLVANAALRFSGSWQHYNSKCYFFFLSRKASFFYHYYSRNSGEKFCWDCNRGGAECAQCAMHQNTEKKLFALFISIATEQLELIDETETLTTKNRFPNAVFVETIWRND